MNVLRLTVIDVGWGDSLLLETGDTASQTGWHFALIDSNDTATLRSSYIFLKRHFERHLMPLPSPLFDWVLLTHGHSDHGAGLKRTVQEFGTRNLWYPRVPSYPGRRAPVFFSALLRFANRSDKVGHHEVVDQHSALPAGGQNFGQASLRVLWPPPNRQTTNENNNSVVLLVTFGEVSFVLGGDAEADVWSEIAPQIPANTKVFKVPHHGSYNSLFDTSRRDSTPWLNALPPDAQLAISSHVKPFQHPDERVVGHLQSHGRTLYRTDQNYHLCFETDGQSVTVQRNHI